MASEMNGLYIVTKVQKTSGQAYATYDSQFLILFLYWLHGV